MHRSDLIKKFLDKVNQEAEQAAQNVFDAYQNEWENLLRREKIKGQKLIQGNGGVTYSKIDDPNGSEKFRDQVSQAQYTEQRAGFSANDIE